MNHHRHSLLIRQTMRCAQVGRVPSIGAFTLVELLLATFVGLSSLAAIVLMIISYVNSRNRLEANVRLQDNWSRLQFFLDREIQESVPVTSASSVSASCGSGTIRLSLEIPGNSNRIVYYMTGSNLRRCGPAIDSGGNLSSTVSDNLLLDGVTDFSADTTDLQRPRYMLSLFDVGGVTYTNQSQPTATTFRSRAIN